jgi:hypothetical protein
MSTSVARRSRGFGHWLGFVSRDNAAVMACVIGGRHDRDVPGVEILNDPMWQAFHAFRWIGDFLGHPEPTSSGISVRLETRLLTPEESAEWLRLSSEERQARMRDQVRALEEQQQRRHPFRPS